MDGTPTESAEGTDAGKYIPPCRLAGFYKAPCPLCGRLLTLKCQLYSHKCARSFDPAQRALEQQALAHDAIKARMAPLEQPTERQTDYNIDKRQKYSASLNFKCLFLCFFDFCAYSK